MIGSLAFAVGYVVGFFVSLWLVALLQLVLTCLSIDPDEHLEGGDEGGW